MPKALASGSRPQYIRDPRAGPAAGPAILAANHESIWDPFVLAVVTQREIHVDVPNFAEALRRALRQDPDVILVGEMRDRMTAEIGMRAAMTGHLVLSTLHTNDAISTPARLIDMGVEPFLVASSVRMVMAPGQGAVLAQKAQGAMGGSFNTREFFHGRTRQVVTGVKWFFLLATFALPLVLIALALGR